MGINTHKQATKNYGICDEIKAFFSRILDNELDHQIVDAPANVCRYQYRNDVYNWHHYRHHTLDNLHCEPRYVSALESLSATG